jgi:hypothetical protein
MTANVTFVLAQVADAIKIPNAALRFKPTREQIMAVFAEFGRGGRGGGSGGGGSGSGGARRRDGSGGPGGGGGGSGGRSPMDAATGASGQMPKRDFGDKKPVFKLVDGKPKMVLIKPGLTDGSSTQMLEGDLQPGDQLVTEILGAPTGPTRRIGAF